MERPGCPENYTPMTAENSTGMVLFRCCTASSYASGSWVGDVHTTYSGEEPCRMKSQGVAAGVLCAQPRHYHCSHPIVVGLLPPPQSFFHASMENFMGNFSHEFQYPLPGHPLGLTSFSTSTPVPDTFRSPYTRGPNVDLAQLTASQPATYWIGIR